MEQLAEAVWATVREHGISAVSVRTVAARAGVAVGSLRHVFPTRSELLRFSAELTVRRATERVMAVPRDGAPITVAQAMLEELLPLDEDRRTEMDVNVALIAEAPALPEIVPIRDEAARGIRRLCRVVVNMLGWPAGAGADQQATRLHIMVNGLALHLLSAPEGAEVTWARDLLRRELEQVSRGPVSDRSPRG